MIIVGAIRTLYFFFVAPKSHDVPSRVWCPPAIDRCSSVWSTRVQKSRVKYETYRSGKVFRSFARVSTCQVPVSVFVVIHSSLERQRERFTLETRVDVLVSFLHFGCSCSIHALGRSPFPQKRLFFILPQNQNFNGKIFFFFFRFSTHNFRVFSTREPVGLWTIFWW